MNPKYKIIIADDEPAPREGLTAFFRNQDCGFEVAGVADGGYQALAMAQQYQPDVLLTDIRMPDMDGLELARRCMELPGAPKLLIMSSYDDAVYIKTALQLQAVDYLFKPLDVSELRKVMRQIYEQLEQEREQREHAQENLEHSVEWLKRHFLRDLADGCAQKEEDIKRRASIIGMDIPERAWYGAICVTVENPDAQENEILQLMEDIISTHAEGYVFLWNRENYGAFLYSMLQEGEALTAETEHIAREIEETLAAGGIESSVGWNHTLQTREHISNAFQEARENAKIRHMLGGERASGQEKLTKNGRSELFRIAGEIRDCLVHSDQSAVQKALEQFFELVAQREDISLLYAIQCTSLLVNVAGSALAERNLNRESEHQIQMAVYEKLTHCETLPEMKRVMEEYCDSLRRSMDSCVVSSAEGTIDKIREIVGVQYKNNLTIQSIAEQIYLTPNYICMLFKQMTGQTINQYITEVRIEAAKKYLEDPGVRLADIGIMVGYTEPSYFSKIFKKYVALTPKEYRQMSISLRERTGQQ